jgi:hypothetical protein
METVKSVFEQGNEVAKNGKSIAAIPMTVNGESVNNLPASFVGYVKLPKAGITPKGYDFASVVESTETYSRLTVDIDGSFVKNGKPETIKSNSAVLWGGSINAMQKRAAIVVDGDNVFAQFATK